MSQYLNRNARFAFDICMGGWVLYTAMSLERALPVLKMNKSTLMELNELISKGGASIFDPAIFAFIELLINTKGRKNLMASINFNRLGPLPDIFIQKWDAGHGKTTTTEQPIDRRPGRGDFEKLLSSNPALSRKQYGPGVGTGYGGLGLLNYGTPETIVMAAATDHRSKEFPNNTLGDIVRQMVAYLLRRHSGILVSKATQMWMQFNAEGLPVGHAQPIEVLYIRLPSLAGWEPTAVAICERDEKVPKDPDSNVFADFIVMFGVDTSSIQLPPSSKKYKIDQVYQAAQEIVAYLTQDADLSGARQIRPC